jgi:hypothetical protein
MAEVLKGQSRQGDMVHAGQVMSADVGFKCVSRIWYDKTQSISDGIDQILDNAKSREDILCPAKHMGMGLNSDNRLVLEFLDGREFVPTDHAYKQLATWCGVSHQFVKDMNNPVTAQNGKVKYERDQKDAETLLHVFQNGYRRIEGEKEFRFRTYGDGTLRAMLSDRYAVLDNVWYLETLAELFKEIGGDEPRLSHWKGDADTLFGNVLIPDTCRQESDSDYGGMISVSNCEIGKRRLSQIPSVFRAICMNGCIWDQESGENISKVHRGAINLKEMRSLIAENINDQIPLMAEGIARFLALKDREIAKDVKLSNIFAMVAYENAMSFGVSGQAATMVKKFTDFEASNRNLFGIVNAVTRAGQEYNPTEWVRFDTIAGKLMNMSDGQWTNLQARAKAMDVKVYNKVYGVVTAA